MALKYKCPCCGYYTLEEPNVYEVCTICWWEDDNLQKDDIYYRGGANKESLAEARENFKKYGVASITSGAVGRKPRKKEILLRQENELFDEWEQFYPELKRDGMVYPEQYVKSERKILYLLPEVKRYIESDVRDFLSEGGSRQQIWKNLARWTKGIISIPNDIRWSELEKITSDEQKKMLEKICVVNVKKDFGSSVTDKKIVRMNAGFLKKQIELYSPELVICCGTAWNYRNDIIRTEFEWKETSRGVLYFKDETGRIVVSYVSPTEINKDNLLYYGLVDCVKEIIDND